MTWQPQTRPPWDHYFMGFAVQAATRGTCKRLQVGAIIVREKQILATGYNGSPAGEPHCVGNECDMDGGHCVRTVHAEMNAVTQAAKNGTTIAPGATIYTTATPCWNCFRVLISLGVKRYVYRMDYRFEGANADRIMNAASRQGVELLKLPLCYHCNDTGEIGPHDDKYVCCMCVVALRKASERK